jgi:hypothetical protein
LCRPAPIIRCSGSIPSATNRSAAQVLLEHSDPNSRGAAGPRPLLVTGRYGSGHTVYLGFPGTWRWRKAGRQAEFFDKFWIQAVRFLAEGRALEGRRRGWVQTDRDRYELGETLGITARLQDAAYNPLVLPKVEAHVQVAGEATETVPLAPLANQPGDYAASLIARRTGLHTLRVPLPAGESDGGLIETSFTVELPSAETSQVWLNQPLLADLAQLSGGQYFDVSELNKLADAIPDRTTTVESRSQPIPLWDVRGMLVALVGLLCTEWLLRKRYRLL